jgi:hypothetical protein
MPYHVQSNHPGCPATKPFGVVKDDGGAKMGCHATKMDADAQIAALYASEAGSAKAQDLTYDADLDKED